MDPLDPPVEMVYTFLRGTDRVPSIEEEIRNEYRVYDQSSMGMEDWPGDPPHFGSLADPLNLNPHQFLGQGGLSLDADGAEMNAIISSHDYTTSVENFATPPPETTRNTPPWDNAQIEKLIAREQQVIAAKQLIGEIEAVMHAVAVKADKIPAIRAEEQAFIKHTREMMDKERRDLDNHMEQARDRYQRESSECETMRKQAREQIDKERAEFEAWVKQARDQLDNERAEFEASMKQIREDLDKERAELHKKIQSIDTLSPDLAARENSIIVETIESCHSLKSLTSKLAEIIDSQVSGESTDTTGAKTQKKRPKISR